MQVRSLGLVIALLLGCEHPAELEEDLDSLTVEGDAGFLGDADLANAVACEEGLHVVKQRAQVFADDGTSTCSFTPVPMFVCIEGFCGDGRCEAPEAIACGCSLDCPIADD